jgi:biopolymer transport protein ExbD
MITRPLDLAAKLRRAPRSNDWLFFVNGGLLVLFFSLFGSRFVLAPSLAVELPEIAGVPDARPTTDFITVSESGQIYIPKGPVDMAGFEKWLGDQVAAAKSQAGATEPVLLILLDARASTKLFVEISSAARRAGFVVRVAAREGKTAGEGR